MEIDETDDKDGHIYRIKNWWNTGNINRGERERNKLSIKYNRGVNIGNKEAKIKENKI